MLRRGWISLSLLGYHQHFALEKLLTFVSIWTEASDKWGNSQRSIYHLGNLNSRRMFCHKFNWQAYIGNEACYFQNYNQPIFLESNINSYFEHILVYVHFHYLYIKIRCAQFPALLFWMVIKKCSYKLWVIQYFGVKGDFHNVFSQLTNNFFAILQTC